jgi:hypothetical protein
LASISLSLSLTPKVAGWTLQPSSGGNLARFHNQARNFKIFVAQRSLTEQKTAFSGQKSQSCAQ